MANALQLVSCVYQAAFPVAYKYSRLHVANEKVFDMLTS